MKILKNVVILLVFPFSLSFAFERDTKINYEDGPDYEIKHGCLNQLKSGWSLLVEGFKNALTADEIYISDHNNPKQVQEIKKPKKRTKQD